MRTTTIMSVALLAASTAALAQVASTPVEQKTGQDGSDANRTAANDLAPASNATTAPAGTVVPDPKSGDRPNR